MKSALKIFIASALCFIGSASFAELNIYLMPRVENRQEGIKLSDMARIEGMLADVKLVKDLKISKEVLSDGYIDRSEVMNLVRARVNDVVYIYGSSVKIIIDTAADEPAALEEIKSGSVVTFIVVNRGVTIRSHGIAIEGGRTGDTIQVKLKKSKIARGRITGENTVELEL